MKQLRVPVTVLAAINTRRLVTAQVNQHKKYATKPAEKYLVVTTSAKTRPPVSYYVNADTMSMLMSNISETNQLFELNQNDNIQVGCMIMMYIII